MQQAHLFVNQQLQEDRYAPISPAFKKLPYKRNKGGPAWWTVKNANDLRCMFSLFGGGWQALTLLLSGDKTVMKRDPHKHNYTQLSFQKSCALAIQYYGIFKKLHEKLEHKTIIK